MSFQKPYTLIPVTTILVFAVCYVLAALQYPGGSGMYPNSTGFSVRFNYLCDLLDAETYNGALNSGKSWAQLGLSVLCLGLMYLWLKIPLLLKSSLWRIKLMYSSALMALGTTSFLLFAEHDVTVRIAGLFGVIAVFLATQGLWYARSFRLAWWGICCLLILMLNYVMYETGGFYEVLPLFQKVTFIIFLGWFSALNLQIYRFEIKDKEGKSINYRSLKIS